jgi:hypothetical protein
MKDQLLEPQNLEVITSSKFNTQSKSGFAAKLIFIWNGIVSSIIEFANSADEPEVYSRRNKFGKTYWVIYNPLLRQRMFFSSEAEVRNFLDCRYYR